LRRFLIIAILLFSCSALGIASDSDQKGQTSSGDAARKQELSKWESPIKDPNNPNEVMQVKWDAIAKVLSCKDLDQQAKEKAINVIIDPIFDFKLMGKLTLGKTNWSKLSESQSEKFIKLFIERLKDAYRDKISSYNNEKVEFQPAVKDNNSVLITMTVVSEDKKYTILYKLRRVDKSWKIYDMEIEGVSVIITYRSQFNDILSHDSVEEFLRQLEKKTVS